MAKTTKTQRLPKATTLPTPEPATQPSAAPTDIAAMLQVASDPSLTVAPWKDRRQLATCPHCGEEHQSPLAYATRLLRRGTQTPEEIAWLQNHLRDVVLPAGAARC